MPSIGSERATVQNPLVAYAMEIGWRTYHRTRRSRCGVAKAHALLSDPARQAGQPESGVITVTRRRSSEQDRERPQ